MNELKTLNEIRFISYLTHEEYANIEIKKQLKKEAIKWINALNTTKDPYSEFGTYHDSGYGEYTSDRFGTVINWIQDFFNITGVELNEKSK